MRIVSWNCNGAFRKKFKAILKYDADIYVILECEDPRKSKDSEYIKFANNFLWIGDSKNKGIGIFGKENILLKKLDWSDEYEGHKVKHFLPFIINNSIKMLAVWTHYNNSPTFGYIGQFWKYLKINKDKLKNAVIIGDFNSNVVWDKWERWWNHTDVIKLLNQIGLESAYHKNLKEEQGKETKSTFFLHRKFEKSYHIDYCFAPIELNIKEFELGKYDDWIKLSDHIPILITIA